VIHREKKAREKEKYAREKEITQSKKGVSSQMNANLLDERRVTE
jgi:hypothetical protein